MIMASAINFTTAIKTLYTQHQQKKPQTNSPHLEGWPPQGGRDGYFPYPKEDARQSAVEVVYSFRTAFTRRSTFSRVFCPIIPH